MLHRLLSGGLLPWLVSMTCQITYRTMSPLGKESNLSSLLEVLSSDWRAVYQNEGDLNWVILIGRSLGILWHFLEFMEAVHCTP